MATMTIEGGQPAAEAETPQWRLLLRYSGGVRARVAIGGVLTFIGTMTGLTQPLLAHLVINAITSRQPVLHLLGILAGVVLAGGACLALGYYLLEYAGETVVFTLRTKLIHKILRLRIGVADTIQPGDLMSRLVADTTLLRQVTTQGLVSAVTGVISMVGTLVLMGVLDPALLVVTLTSVGVMTATIRWSAARIGRATGQAQAAVGSMAALLDRSLGAFRTVKAAGAEPVEIERLSDSARTAWTLGLRLARWQAVSGSTAVLTLQTSFLIVLGVGGARVASGTITVSTLIAFMLFVLYLNQPINALSTAYGQYQAGTAAAARLERVLALDSEPVDRRPVPGQPSLPPLAPRTPVSLPLNGQAPGLAGARTILGGPTITNGYPAVGTGWNWNWKWDCATVDFEDVVFSYSPMTPPVHYGVTFSVPPGGMTAIVGPSGAGKSTLFALIERFYDVTGGRILVDGRDVRDWPLGQLRSSIGYVEQDTPALAGTLRENLALGLGKVPDEQLYEVLSLARLGEVVDRLPGGIDDEVGNRGGSLSGGERQRLSIARALLRAPRLLLLDEATSQLDAANEKALRDTIIAAAAAATVVVVAHRLSTVVSACQIVVMEAGRVRACGTHDQLLRYDPLYRELAATQLLATRTS
jgi:ABC-type multidrug transport system fused ATPase/permease subunit